MCRRKVAREADIRARNRLAHSELSPHVQDACPSEFGIAMLLDGCSRVPATPQGQRRRVKEIPGEQRLPAPHRRAHPLGGERNWGGSRRARNLRSHPHLKRAATSINLAETEGAPDWLGYQSCPTPLPGSRLGWIPYIRQALGVVSLPWE